ncbi:Oxidoreductase-like [Rhodopseudomonas palustris HaA2]|uniref:Oxidoreductase-like n=1 Tax=Rhodopseudomonas palustris (strain HaA2) TaxID=316058 RepID=Q2IYD8_RHOP2|nr:Gfo/Idh/MocA family oxidoreductase [Rhodopseudomonas palustris]ABD06772.1 Oxidoreductase-like [Rhodopseudomonas palustris HaA2]
MTAPLRQEPLRLGLCGCGWVIRHCYQPALAELSALFEVVAVFDPDPAALQRAAHAWPAARRCDSFEELLAAHPDAAVIASPNACHLDHATALLAAGISCLVEKPVVRDTADAALLQAAAQSGAALVSGVACRFRDDTRLWLDQVALLGPLTELDLVWSREHGVPSAPWHLRRADGWTGVFADLGYHLLDLAGAALRWRAERIDVAMVQRASQRRGAGASWYVEGSKVRAGSLAYDTDDRFGATLAVDGCRIGLRVAWIDSARGDLVRLEARGARGEAVLSGLFGFSDNRRERDQQVVLRLHGRDKIRTTFETGPELQLCAFATLLRHFHRCVRAGADEEAAALRFAAALGGALREAAA